MLVKTVWNTSIMYGNYEAVIVQQKLHIYRCFNSDKGNLVA